MCPRYSDTPATTCNSTSCSFTAGSTTYGPGFHPHHGDDFPVEDPAMPNTLILPRAWLYTLVLRGRGLPILHLNLPTLVSRMPILTILMTPMSHFCLCMMQLCILYVATVGDGTGTAMGRETPIAIATVATSAALSSTLLCHIYHPTFPFPRCIVPLKRCSIKIECKKRP